MKNPVHTEKTVLRYDNGVTLLLFSGVSDHLLGKDWILSMPLAMLVAMSGLLPSQTIFTSRSISMFVCGLDVNVKNDIYVNVVAVMCSCGLMRIYRPILSLYIYNSNLVAHVLCYSLSPCSFCFHRYFCSIDIQLLVISVIWVIYIHYCWIFLFIQEFQSITHFLHSLLIPHYNFPIHYGIHAHLYSPFRTSGSMNISEASSKSTYGHGHYRHIK